MLGQIIRQAAQSDRPPSAQRDLRYQLLDGPGTEERQRFDNVVRGAVIGIVTKRGHQDCPSPPEIVAC